MQKQCELLTWCKRTLSRSLICLNELSKLQVDNVYPPFIESAPTFAFSFWYQLNVKSKTYNSSVDQTIHS